MVTRPAASSSLGNLLEIHILGLHPSLTESGTQGWTSAMCVFTTLQCVPNAQKRLETTALVESSISLSVSTDQPSSVCSMFSFLLHLKKSSLVFITSSYLPFLHHSIRLFTILSIEHNNKIGSPRPCFPIDTLS